MTTRYYKAVRLDRTSHYDKETKWRKGSTVMVDAPSPVEIGPCGRGIHCSTTLLDAVGYQAGPSIYVEVDPVNIIASDSKKSRCDGVKVIRWLGRDEQDEIAGFKLWEANHPHNPLGPHRTREKEWLKERLGAWASVEASVRASVRASVWAYNGGLFPSITKWVYAKDLGPDPWRPLLDLWYAGYVPSFDGTTWRLHHGKDARIVLEITAEDLKREG